ncbi:MAG: hypothetical protein M1831_005588 [Alyxoria varia]|nr:MAG: hypothetical protein M1831_005588 [Alyxoria varia]
MTKSKEKKESSSTLFFYKQDEPYGYFSQWYMTSMYDETSGHTFNCCEQYMMYHKALTLSDQATASAILRAKSPKDQKRLGRKVKGFSEEAWDRVKFDVVVRANMLKFSQRNAKETDANVYPPEGFQPGEYDVVMLRDLLLATGERELAEASKPDRIWGIGYSAAYAARTDKEKWGQNLLGKALMEVRRKLKEEDEREGEAAGVGK